MTFYRTREIQGVKVFSREAGRLSSSTLLLLHGLSSSSFMYRDFIHLLDDRFHVVAPDYPGCGNSAVPNSETFPYTLDRAAGIILELVHAKIGKKRFSIYMQGEGVSVGLRIASQCPDFIECLVIQNGAAYQEGFKKDKWEPLRSFWEKRNPSTEEAVQKALLSPESLRSVYLDGARNLESFSPDTWNMDCAFLARPGRDRIIMEWLYDLRNDPQYYLKWQSYFREYQPPSLILWGQNDPFFTVQAAEAYKQDLLYSECHLFNTNRFILEEDSEKVARLVTRFLLERTQ